MYTIAVVGLAETGKSTFLHRTFGVKMEKTTQGTPSVCLTGKHNSIALVEMSISEPENESLLPLVKYRPDHVILFLKFTDFVTGITTRAIESVMKLLEVTQSRTTICFSYSENDTFPIGWVRSVSTRKKLDSGELWNLWSAEKIQLVKEKFSSVDVEIIFVGFSLFDECTLPGGCNFAPLVLNSVRPRESTFENEVLSIIGTKADHFYIRQEARKMLGWEIESLPVIDDVKTEHSSINKYIGSFIILALIIAARRCLSQ